MTPNTWNIDTEIEDVDGRYRYLRIYGGHFTGFLAAILAAILDIWHIWLLYVLADVFSVFCDPKNLGIEIKIEAPSDK